MTGTPTYGVPVFTPLHLTPLLTPFCTHCSTRHCPFILDLSGCTHPHTKVSVFVFTLHLAARLMVQAVLLCPVCSTPAPRPAFFLPHRRATTPRYPFYTRLGSALDVVHTHAHYASPAVAQILYKTCSACLGAYPF